MPLNGLPSILLLGSHSKHVEILIGVICKFPVSHFVFPFAIQTVTGLAEGVDTFFLLFAVSETTCLLCLVVTCSAKWAS